MPSGFRILLIGNQHERQGVIFMQEIWKDIDGYEGDYQISNIGNVKSLKNNIILVPSITVYGYKRVCLSKNGIKKNMVIHRLVATAFVENPNKYKIVNHKDENKLNNNADNLEWCDIKYNTNYGTCIERRAKNKQRAVVQYDRDMNYIKTYESIKQASNGNYSMYTHIGQCCRGELKTVGGYVWRYANE